MKTIFWISLYTIYFHREDQVDRKIYVYTHIYDLLYGSYFNEYGLQSFKIFLLDYYFYFWEPRTLLIIFTSLPLTPPRPTASSLPTQFCVLISFYSWACGPLLEHSHPDRGHTLKKKKNYSTRSICSLHLLPSLGVGLPACLPFLPAFYLSWPRAGCHRRCEFIRATALLCLENTVFVLVIHCPGPYGLYTALFHNDPWGSGRVSVRQGIP